jgi:hypothetical protein
VVLQRHHTIHWNKAIPRCGTTTTQRVGLPYRTTTTINKRNFQALSKTNTGVFQTQTISTIRSVNLLVRGAATTSHRLHNIAKSGNKSFHRSIDPSVRGTATTSHRKYQRYQQIVPSTYLSVELQRHRDIHRKKVTLCGDTTTKQRGGFPYGTTTRSGGSWL